MLSRLVSLAALLALSLSGENFY